MIFSMVKTLLWECCWP